MPPGGARSSSAIANPWLFTGQEWMADLGLSNYKNRFYSPKLGRFLQNDPVRFDAGDANLYRYCANNPINHSDPTGLIDPNGVFKEKFKIAEAGFKDAIQQRTGGNLDDESATALARAFTIELGPFEGARLSKANDKRNEAIKNHDEKAAAKAEAKMEEIGADIEGRVREKAKNDPELQKHVDKYDKAKAKAEEEAKKKRGDQPNQKKEEKN